MARDISSPMLASLTSNEIRPGFLADLEFHSETAHVWTGAGTLVWNGNNYLGVGSLGKIGAVTEGSTVGAEGTTISLSGIDQVLLAESLNDIQLGAPATIWFVLFDQNLNILGTPYPLYVGTVDQPQIEMGTEEMTISLKLENRMVNLQRANLRRYTSADQQLYFPTDCAFNWVEILGDQALKFSP